MHISTRLFLCILFTQCFTILVSAKYPCNSIPLSVSSVDTCTNGACSVKQLVQTKVDLAAGKSVCFKLDGDKVDLDKKVVNFTIVDSWISYPVRDCYTSDDPNIDISGFCRCRLAGSVDCGHCSALSFITNDTICVDGSNRGTGCIGSGTHCVKAGFMGGARYKVCDIGRPKIFVDLLIYNSIEYISYQAELEEDLTIKDSEFELTFYDIDKPEDLRDKSVILDLLNPEYMYLVPDEEVNSIHSRDPNKLGWYRANETVTPKVQQLITVNVRDCSNDIFAFGIGVSKFRDALSANPNWFLENKIPGAIWLDVDAELVQNRPAIYDPPLPTLTQGSYFLTASGDIECLGIQTGNIPCQTGTYNLCDNIPTLDDVDVNTCSGPNLPNIWTNYGMCDPNAGECIVKCSPWIAYYSGVFDYTFIGGEPVTGCDQTNTQNYVRQCNAISGAACPICALQWGIQTLNLRNDSDGVLDTTGYCDVSELYSDTNAWVYGNIWPQNHLGVYKLAQLHPQGQNATNLFFFTDIENPAVTQQMFNVTSDHIITSNVIEKSKLSIEFKNVHIQFVNENIDPEIDSVKDDDEFLKIWAHARGSEGECLLTVSDDVAPSKIVELKFDSNEYRLPLKIDKFTGWIDIELRCYKNVAKAKAKVEIDRGGIDFKFDTIEPEHVKELKSNDDLWDKAASGAKKTGNALSRFFSRMFNLTGNAVSDFFLGIALSILFFIVSVIALIFAYYLLKKLFCWLWMKAKESRYAKMMFDMNSNTSSTYMGSNKFSYKKI